MLSYIYAFGDFLFASDREKEIYTDINPAGLFTNVKSYKLIVLHIKSHNLLSHEELNIIEIELGPLYLKCCGDKIDLDDTLHVFRKASRAASFTILKLISQTCDATVKKLGITYLTILSQKTSNAFTDGKSSDIYRKERFSALIKAHSVNFINTTLD